MNNKTQNNTENNNEAEGKVSKARRAASFELKKTIANIKDALGNAKLNDWERKFLGDIAEKFEKYGLGARMTAMQVMTLNKIVVKAAIEA